VPRCVFPPAVDHAGGAEFVVKETDFAGAPDLLDRAAKASDRSLAGVEVHPRASEKKDLRFGHVVVLS
jgi:hypothetical protein